MAKEFGRPEDFAALDAHLRETSGDADGSSIGDYFSRPDTEYIENYIRQVGHEGLNAMPMDFRRPLIGGAWKPGGNAGKNWLSMAIWYRPEWSGWGYQLGSLNLGFDFNGLVAVDHEERLRLLRSERSHIESKALGWGSMPDPEKVRAVIGPNAPIVKLSAFSIAKALDPSKRRNPNSSFPKWPY